MNVWQLTTAFTEDRQRWHDTRDQEDGPLVCDDAMDHFDFLYGGLHGLSDTTREAAIKLWLHRQAS